MVDDLFTLDRHTPAAVDLDDLVRRRRADCDRPETGPEPQVMDHLRGSFDGLELPADVVPQQR